MAKQERVDDSPTRQRSRFDDEGVAEAAAEAIREDDVDIDERLDAKLRGERGGGTDGERRDRFRR
ncbi:hypothetical protein [Rhizomonospora bruguierae]|uniref:hypothetical protein n=1 Tax=Rhizomonospora bruguierae TaxID=1581705 RepID=UPI001BCFC7CC|nr:hypothetical protein [Micromonospora sp. NBRC 107566]